MIYMMSDSLQKPVGFGTMGRKWKMVGRTGNMGNQIATSMKSTNKTALAFSRISVTNGATGSAGMPLRSFAK